VINIDAESNQIIVGPKESLIIQNLELRDLNILCEEKDFSNHILIKVRSTGRLLKAKVNIKKNSANINIIDGEAGISPGQACVFYSKDERGDKLLGGGWIYKTTNKNLST
jgi:tRNA-specific 2-thiouridylase